MLLRPLPNPPFSVRSVYDEHNFPPAFRDSPSPQKIESPDNMAMVALRVESLPVAPLSWPRIMANSISLHSFFHRITFFLSMLILVEL